MTRLASNGRWVRFARQWAVPISALISLVAAALLVAVELEGQPVPGLATQQPADDRSVSTDFGHMVAYTQTIPGSEVQFQMLPIPGGKTIIGSPADEAGRHADEGPQVEVAVEPFWMGRCEVTWAEYHEFTRLAAVFDRFNDLGIRPVNDANQVDAVTAPSKLYDPSFTYRSGDEPQRPAVAMSQFAAKQYTKWLSLLTGQFYRLPTEAEWEHACRAGSATAYSFGDDPAALDQHAWHFENAGDQTHFVGQKLPNAWGLYDMHGNVAEWVLDAYQPDWYGTLAEKTGTIAAGVAVCPPASLFPRVLRGGSWDDQAAACRSAARGKSHDDDWRSYDPNSPQSPWWFASEDSQDVGFRIVRPLVPPPREEWNKYWDADLEQIQRDVDYRIDSEGRGERGLVNPELPAAIESLPPRG